MTTQVNGDTGVDRMSYLPAGTGAITTDVQTKLRENVSIEDFGGVAGLATDPAINDVAILLAFNYLESVGGGILHMRKQYYVFSVGLLIPNGVTVEGSGVGAWDTVFGNRDKEWTGTSLIFKGTGAKAEGFYGVTDRSVTGGWRPDTAIPANTYKLTNFMNTDSATSARATPRAFSAAIAPKVRSVGDLHAYHWGLKNIRVVPWIGIDGVSDYSNVATSSLGDEWDVGLYVVNSEYEHFENVQVVGYWRIAGTLKVQPGATEWGSGERGSYIRFKTQGFHGLVLRGSDNNPITASTANTVEIPWTASHFWPNSGKFEVPGGVDYTYTGLSKTGDKLTFTGVSPDSSGLAANNIRPYYRGTGVAGSQFTNVVVSGLSHVSGLPATSLGFVDHSIGFEISGFPLRGFCFNDFKVQNTSADPCNSFFGDCDDVLMFGCQFENGKVIATPYKTEQTWVTYPVGNTTDMRLYGHIWSADKTLFTPRTYFDDGEVFGPVNSTSSTEDVIATQVGKIKVIRKNTDIALQIQDGDGTALVEVAATSGGLVIKNGRQLSLTGGSALINADAAANLSLRNGTTTRLTMFGASGNFAAGADNTQTWGTSAGRWSTIYAGTGTINTSDGREKQQINTLSDAEKAVAIRLKGMIRSFKFNDAVSIKGDSARIHVGVIVQDVKAAFEAEGLNPFAYALFCYDEWPDEFDDDGTLTIAAGNRYGVRYEELFAFIISTL